MKAGVASPHSSTSRSSRPEMRTTAGELVHVVTEMDVDALDELGRMPPENIIVETADGETGSYGLIYKPLDFDHPNKYPVINYIYNGHSPLGYPKTFTDVRGLS